jgi:hypothetical protein
MEPIASFEKQIDAAIRLGSLLAIIALTPHFLTARTAAAVKRPPEAGTVSRTAAKAVSAAPAGKARLRIQAAW